MPLTVKELLASAQIAISNDNLDEAKALMSKARVVKDYDSFEPDPPAQTDPRTADMETQLAELKAFRAKVEAEPATKAAGILIVTDDETDKKAAKPWRTLGELLVGVRDASMFPHRMDERLKAQKAILGASSGVPSDGGFLIQQDFASEIFKIAHDTGAIMSRTRRIPIGPNANGLKINAIDENSRATGSRWGGVQAYWEAEGDAASATKPKFRQLNLSLNKLLAVMYATDELLADATALGAVAQQAVSEEIIYEVENSIFRGSGVGKPMGILNATATVSVTKEDGQAAATLVTANLFKMWSRLHGRSRANAVWLYNQDIEPQLMALSLSVGTAGGQVVYLPPGGLSQSPYSTLLGRPMIPVEYASTLGTVGDIVLADMSQYIVIDKGGVQAAESMHVQFLTDQMTYRWTYRIDGQPAWRSALTPANGTNTQSPFITLETRS